MSEKPKTEKSVKVTARFHEDTPQKHCATGYGGGIKCDHFQKYIFVHWYGNNEKPVCELFPIGLKHDDVKVLRCTGCINAFNRYPEILEKEEFAINRTMIPFKR